jgi:spore coat polysaccharide biosynthesis protein SpsF
VKVVVIVQARMGSSRLPGKVMMPLAGEPMLARCINRVRRAPLVDEVVVATTTLPADDAIEQLCKEYKWPCFRGSEDDVLDRYYRAARVFKADIVIRITSDCPLIDPEIVEQVVREFQNLAPNIDYAYNILPQGDFPRGLDVEVVSYDVLEQIWRLDNNPAWREHVTPFITQHPGMFNIHEVITDLPQIRWTVDTPEDLELVSNIFNHFGHDHFSSRDVLSVLKENPQWAELNQHVRQKSL